jgi:carboxymethylenebutenolidase
MIAGLVMSAAHGCNSSPSPPRAKQAPPPTSPVNVADAGTALEPELVTFSSGALTLHGYLYVPPGAGPFPAIVFNHGSEELPGTKRGQALFYVNHGFVLFVPHRRGHGRSHEAGSYIGPIAQQAKLDPESPALAGALDTESDDVMAAVAYVAALPNVDRTRVANIGCSFGGIHALLAAERGTGLVATVDFAGASIMWAQNRPLRERMKVAARNAKVPVFFLQAENDFDTAPTRVLAEEMQRAGKTARMKIFPPHGSGPQDGHGFCVGGVDPPWGPDVLAFLGETMR